MNFITHRKLSLRIVYPLTSWIFFCITFMFSGNILAIELSGSDSVSILNKASVIIDGNRLFTVRGIISYPASVRSKVIEERIVNIAKENSISPELIQIIPGEVSDTIFMKGNVIMNVFDVDAELEGVKRSILTPVIRAKIINSINSYRHERKTETLVTNTLKAVGAALIALFLLLLLTWVTKKIIKSLEKKLKTKIDTIETRSFQLLRSDQLWISILGIVRSLKFILALIILFLSAQYILGLYPWTRSVSTTLLGLFLVPLGTIGSAFLNFIPNLAFLVIIFYVTKYLLKLIKILFNGIGLGNISIRGFEPEWAFPTYKIIRTLFVVFAIIVSYPYIPGSESAAFKGISIFAGLLFSLGSSSVIGNIMAGYSMVYRRTFKVGDIVKIEKFLGQVIDLKLLVTKIRTFKNEEIVVPNSLILSNNIVNYTSALSSSKGIILHIDVGIGYETPWRQVEGMLVLAAERTKGVLKEPAPFIHQKSLGDFAVTYELNVYCDDPPNMVKYYTALNQNILDVFNENNVQIMTPSYEADPEQPKLVPKEQWFTPVLGKEENREGKSLS